MDAKVAIVILNFCNYQDTIDCIQSISMINTELCGIVVVDNGSTNNAFEILSNLYKQNKNIYVLKASKNLGFAKGNNLGISYAIKHLGARFVLSVNSDVLFTESEYINILIKAYKPGIGIIGSIVRQRGKSNHIAYVKYPDVIYRYMQLFFEYIDMSLLAEQMYCILRKSKRGISYLSGSSILFTPDFLDIYEGFYPRTFLYMEEHLLYLMCELGGLKQVKVLETSVLHKQAGSTPPDLGIGSKQQRKCYLKAYKYVVWLATLLVIRGEGKNEKK